MLLGAIDVAIADVAGHNVTRQRDLDGQRRCERQHGNFVFAAAVALCHLAAQRTRSGADVGEARLIWQHDVEGEQTWTGILAANDLGDCIEAHDCDPRFSQHAYIRPAAAAAASGRRKSGCAMAISWRARSETELPRNSAMPYSVTTMSASLRAVVTMPPDNLGTIRDRVPLRAVASSAMMARPPLDFRQPRMKSPCPPTIPMCRPSAISALI